MRQSSTEAMIMNRDTEKYIVLVSEEIMHTNEADEVSNWNVLHN